MNKPSARKLHRSLAWVMVFGLVYLTLSGVLLNHSKALDLPNIDIKNPLLLKWYGQSAAVVSQSFSVNQHWITRINQNLYWDDKLLPLQGEIYQILPHEPFLFIRQASQVAFLSSTGELIDLIPLPEKLQKQNESQLFVSQQQIYLMIDQQVWSLNAEYSEFVLNTDNATSTFKMTTEALTNNPLPETLKTKLLALAPSGLTLEKIILELHNGYFIGSIGPWLLDLFALLILITIITGIRLHIKK